MSLIFGFAPTKCKIIKATKDEISQNIDMVDIPLKGAADLRLKDYGV
jgi:hypothetical protein